MRMGKGELAFSAIVAISQKRCKIERRLILITSRTSHTRFRLVPKSTTSDDLNDHYELCFGIHGFFRVQHENLNVQKCGALTIIFWQYKVMRIFEVGFWRGDVKRQGTEGSGRKTAIFSDLGRYISENFRDNANIFIR